MSSGGGGGGDWAPTRALETFTGNARVARASANALNDQLRQLSETGKESAHSLQLLGLALVFVNPLLGLVTILAAGVTQSFEDLANLDLAQNISQLGSALQVTNEEFLRMRGPIEAARGETGDLGLALREYGRVQTEITIAHEHWTAALRRNATAVAAGVETSEQAYIALEAEREQIQQHLSDLDREERAARTNLDTTRRRTEAWRQLGIEADRQRGTLWERLALLKQDAVLEDLLTQKTREKILVTDDELQRTKKLAEFEEEYLGGVGTETLKLLNEVVAEHNRLSQVLEAEQHVIERTASITRSAIGTAAAGAFDAYADALDKSITANNLFASGMDRNLRNAAAAAIRSIGQQAAVEAAMETAQGLKDLAFGLPTSAIHFEAAAAFAAVALAAGVGAGAVSVAGPRAAGGRGGRGGSERGGPQITNQFTIIGVIDTAARQELLRQLAEASVGGDY